MNTLYIAGTIYVYFDMVLMVEKFCWKSRCNVMLRVCVNHIFYRVHTSVFHSEKQIGRVGNNTFIDQIIISCPSLITALRFVGGKVAWCLEDQVWVLRIPRFFRLVKLGWCCGVGWFLWCFREGSRILFDRKSVRERVFESRNLQIQQFWNRIEFYWKRFKIS